MNATKEPPVSILRAAGTDVAVRRIAGARTDTGTGNNSGPVLVFLHEGLGCITMWRDFPDTLARAVGLPALVYDRPGYGKSPAMADAIADGGAWFAHEAATILPALLAASGIADAILIGHSDGGTIALLNAGLHAERKAAGQGRVQGVVTIAAHVFVEPESLAGVAAARAAWRDTGLPHRLARHHGAQTEAMFRRWATIWSAPAFRAWNIEDRLAAIRCPVLALQGAGDEYGTERQVAAIAAGVSGRAESLILPDCGHSPHLEARDATLARIARFIGTLLE